MAAASLVKKNWVPACSTNWSGKVKGVGYTVSLMASLVEWMGNLQHPTLDLT